MQNSSSSPPIAEVDVQGNDKVVERSSDTTQASSWGSLLSPSYITQSIQNAHLPSTLGVTIDFWETAKKYEQTLQDYVPRMLKSAAADFKSPKFTDITLAMNNIVHATATFRDNIKGALDARHITFDALTKEFEAIFAATVNGLKKLPPKSPNKAPGHAERQEIVDKIMDGTRLALTDLATRHGINIEFVTAYLGILRPQVHALVVAVGDINEQHPQLLPTVTFSIAALLIPESWILRPFLSMFGFGPAGPIKGSAAAWLQRYFWGGAVKAGSWFSLLQAAGMGVIPVWAGVVIKAPLIIGGSLWAMRPRFSNRA